MAEKMVFPASRLKPWPNLNPRKRFDTKEQQQLEASIRERGIDADLLVGVPLDEADRNAGMGWIVAGERRWRAAAAINPEYECPASVKEYTEQEALATALVENIQRDNLSPLETARGIRRLLDAGDKQRDVAQKLTLSAPQVSNLVGLLDLPEPVQELVDTGAVDQTAARDFLRPFTKLADDYAQRFFKLVVAEVGKVLKDSTLERIGRGHLKKIVQEVAVERSRPLATSSLDTEQPLFDADVHVGGCDCNGPEFDYGTGERTVRCFNPTWWKAAQKEAQAAKKEEEEARLKKLAAAQSNGTAKVLSQRDVQAMPVGALVDMLDSKGTLDPAELVDARTAIITVNGEQRVQVNDTEAVQRARASAQKRKAELVAKLAEERGSADRRQYGDVDFEPWMFTAALKARPGNDALLIVLRELGMLANVAKASEVPALLDKLDSEAAFLFGKVVAARARREDLDPAYLSRRADDMLAKQWAGELEMIAGAALKGAKIAAGGKPRKRRTDDGDAGEALRTTLSSES